MNSEPSSVVNTSPSLSGQSALAATPGIGESHVGAGVEVDDVAEELVSVEEEDASEDVEVIISSEEVEVEDISEDVEVIISSDEVELVDSSEDVEVTISSDDVDVERSLEVVAVASCSSRSSASTDEVTGSEVDVVINSVVLD
jgi:hypothetical protein